MFYFKVSDSSGNISLFTREPSASENLMCQITTLLCSVWAIDLPAGERTWRSGEGAAPAWRNALLSDWEMPRGVWVLWLLLWPRGKRWSHRCPGQVWAPLYVPLLLWVLLGCPWTKEDQYLIFWALYSYVAVVKTHFGGKIHLNK